MSEFCKVKLFFHAIGYALGNILACLISTSPLVRVTVMRSHQTWAALLSCRTPAGLFRRGERKKRNLGTLLQPARLRPTGDARWVTEAQA